MYSLVTLSIYEQNIIQLNTAFKWCAKSSFASFRDLFNKKNEVDLYIDNINYSEAGNKKIAQALAPYVMKSLKE